MKRRKPVSISIMVLLVTLSAAVSLAQSFYPLQVGNRWVYRNTDLWVGGTTDTTSVVVAGDTVMPNGKRYFRFHGGEPIDGRYARADSAWIYYYNYQSQDMPFFKLNPAVNEQWTVNLYRWFFVRYLGRDTITVFGKETAIQRYYLDGLAVMYANLSEKFGPFFIQDLYDPPGVNVTERRLIGAIIADTVYGTVVSVPGDNAVPSAFTLRQNFPNPFNPTTTFSFEIPYSSFVTLKIIDILGREVATLVNEEMKPGSYERVFDARLYSPHSGGLASGVYFYQLKGGGVIETKKMLLAK